MSYWGQYVSVAERKRKAAKKIQDAAKKGQPMSPVTIEGRTIARTFWGSAWCDHLEQYCDQENRLPRGRTYVRNGSVIDLRVSEGKIAAVVMGSELYQVSIAIQPMKKARWEALIKACAGKIDSLIELLQGKLSSAVINEIIRPETGLFPLLNEITTECSCPDWSALCKHRAAVLYGIGARLDTAPELLFTLRHVNPAELIASAAADNLFIASTSPDPLKGSDLSDLFGIEMIPDQEKLQQAAPIILPVQKPSAANAPKHKSYQSVQRKSRRVNKSASKKTTVPEDLDLTISQAALLLRISPRKLTQLLDAKTIPSTRLGKQIRVSFQAILDYRKQNL